MVLNVTTTNSEILNAIEVLERKVEKKSKCISENCPAFIKVNTKIKIFIALIFILISVATFNFTMLEAFKKDVKLDIKEIDRNLSCQASNNVKANVEIKNIVEDLQRMENFYSKIHELSDVIDKIIKKSGDM